MLALLVVACTSPSTETKLHTPTPTDTDTTTRGSPPTATITTPADNAEVGLDLVLSGSASDEETPSQDLSVWWESDIDGWLSGASPASSGTFADEVTLSPGPHVIKLLVEDDALNRTEATVGVTATEPEVQDTVDTGTVTTPPTTPAVQCPPFDATNWTLHSDNNPTLVHSGGTEQVLVPDSYLSASGAAIWTGGLAVPFTIDFEYKIDDDNGVPGGMGYATADGMAVQLMKDPGVYGTTAPPVGETRGVLNDGSGYAVELVVYGPRRLLITRGTGQVLYSAFSSDIFTGSAWESVQIEVDATSIEVTHAGVVHTQAVTVDTTFDGLIVSAATGGEDGLHSIRNLCITQ